MGETIYNLPELFCNGKPCDTNIYFYRTYKSSRNNKVKFSQNLICIMQAGEKQISNQSVQEKFDNSNLYILGTGNTLMTETTTDDHQYRTILLFFSNEYLVSFLNRHLVTLPKTPRIINCLKLTKDEFLLNYEQSLDILNEQLINNQELLKTKIDEILLYLIKTKPTELNSLLKNILNDDKNILFTGVIQANLNNNLSVSELAFLCNMSTSTFKRRFTEVYNATPKQYFIGQKMTRAVALLKEDRTPSEIYFELGYESLSAFSSEFKKYWGVSPKTYVSNLSV